MTLNSTYEINFSLVSIDTLSLSLSHTHTYSIPQIDLDFIRIK